MKIICLALRGTTTPHKGTAIRTIDRTRTHFAERGVDATFYYGLHAERLGLLTRLAYEVDNPGSGFVMGAGPIGCWLSHRSMWSACLLLPDDEFLILEQDARFPVDWRARFDRALADVPDDWDLLYVGSCCAGALYEEAPDRLAPLQARANEHVRGDVWRAHPMCTHAYIVRRRALETMIDTSDSVGVYAPIDISLARHTMQRLNVYAVLPRIVDQFDTELPP